MKSPSRRVDEAFEQTKVSSSVSSAMKVVEVLGGLAVNGDKMVLWRAREFECDTLKQCGIRCQGFLNLDISAMDNS